MNARDISIFVGSFRPSNYGHEYIGYTNMTPQQAAQFLPIIKAFSEGRQIQKHGSNGEWIDMVYLTFEDHPSCYRIAPKPTRCKVGLFKRNNSSWTTSIPEKDWERAQEYLYFIRWISDPIEYTEKD